MEMSGRPHDPPSLPWGNDPQYLFYRRLCGSRSRSGRIGRKKKSVVRTWIRKQSIHPVVSPYTDYKLSSPAWPYCFHFQGCVDQDGGSHFHCLLLKIHEVDCVWNVMAHALKPDFVFRRNGRVHLNRQGRQFSRLLAAEECTPAVVMLDTPFSEVAWRVLVTHHSPVFSSLPPPPLRHCWPSCFKRSLPSKRRKTAQRHTPDDV
jgi:hypothetical protein